MFSSSHGGASAKAPSSGWASGDLEIIFGQTIPRDNQNSRNNSPPSFNANDSITRSLSSGGIAGITIGAIVFMAIMASGVLVWLRKRQRLPMVVPDSSVNKQQYSELEGSVLHQLNQPQVPPQEMAGSEVIKKA